MVHAEIGLDHNIGHSGVVSHFLLSRVADGASRPCFSILWEWFPLYRIQPRQ